jgi:hypothetical protein
MADVRECARCGRVLVDEDEQGWYFQVPVTDPRAPGLVFMDRVHDCDGKPHDVRLRVADPLSAALEPIRVRSRWTSSAREVAAPGATALKSADDVPRLLGAVDAALRFHGAKKTANGIPVCPRCSRAEGQFVKAPCPEVQAITSALLGEEKNDAG